MGEKKTAKKLKDGLCWGKCAKKDENIQNGTACAKQDKKREK